MNYTDFLKNKQVRTMPTGFKVSADTLSKKAFDWQRHCTSWALERGKAALFEDCGLGKTLQQLMWADEVNKAIDKPVLILSPLAVAPQTRAEGVKFSIDVNICENQADVQSGINITNYEKLDKFDTSTFGAVVLDESSILKSYMGKTKREIIKRFENTPYKLACTATPAPNDLMELLNHAEFLGIMRSNEALSIWFIADQSQSGKYRLKKHAEKDFWQWVSSWAVCISKPSDIGFSDEGYILPDLNENDVIVSSSTAETAFTDIARQVDTSATGYHKERRRTLKQRCEKTAELVNNNNQFVVWCGMNDEADELKQIIPDSVEIRGNDKAERKEHAAMSFVKGDIRVLISKPSIFGYGLNFQNCYNSVFCGMDYSFENYYQAVRRFYRFGQKNEVNIYRVLGDTEKNILDTINRKASMKAQMQSSMADAVREFQTKKLNTYHLDLTTRQEDMPSWLKGA
ncbi:MAG: helicase [Ruminococcus sp.]|nr:helicase [Ruminococcus sp.]